MVMSLRRPTHDSEADGGADGVIAFPASPARSPVKERLPSDVNPRARRNAAAALLALTMIFWTIAVIVAAYLFF